MATFLQLYGAKLDRELASADRTKLFTTERRKEAVNEAQKEFVRLTECFLKQGTIAVVDGTAEYDLEASFSDFTWLAKQGVEIRIYDGTNYRYLAGDDLPITTIERLNREEPGWRSAAAGIPMCQYIKEDGGVQYLGFHPAPDVGSGETWTVMVPYIVNPADMSADIDEPFTLSSNIKKRMWPWHQALVHFAAGFLERFRKEAQREDKQMKLFAGYVADYLQRQRPKGGQQVQYTRNYRLEARRARGGRAVNVNRDFA